jgi:hypothetical protein
MRSSAAILSLFSLLATAAFGAPADSDKVGARDDYIPCYYNEQCPGLCAAGDMYIDCSASWV